jgi:GTPase SAR1 family protein
MNGHVYDSATKCFVSLKASNPDLRAEKWNEADTRSKLIDALFIQCLGWRETDIRRELSSCSGRLDYQFSIVQPTIIVEAKRVSYFLPAKIGKTCERAKLASLVNANPTLREPLEQVRGYCADRSVPLAVVTNGRTILAFISVRTDGIAWYDGDAFIIHDVFDEKLNFTELYNLRSRDAVVAGTLHTQLLGKPSAITPTSVVSGYPDPRILLSPNKLGRVLEPVIHPIFDQASDDNSLDVIEHCYVLPPDTTAPAEYSALLRDSPPHYAVNAKSIDRRNAFDRFEDTIGSLMKTEPSPQMVLVIGGVGVGKTTFLRRFFQVYLPKKEDQIHGCKESCLPLYVNFQRPGADPTKVDRVIYERLRDQIEELDGKRVPRQKKDFDFFSTEGLQHIFLKPYQRFLKNEGSLAQIDPNKFQELRRAFLAKHRDDVEGFVDGAIQVLRDRYHQKIVVIIDNVDQCSADYQKAVYLFCRTLENRFKTLVVVALREEWYWHHGVGKEGPLSAYHNLVFHIPSPRTRDVLKKRLEYAIDKTKDCEFPAISIGLGKSATLEPIHLQRYIQICSEAFFDNEDIAGFFECLSNGSVRRGLESFLEFLRSGHTHEDEYLEAMLNGRAYRLRHHQVFKSIAYGQYRHYSGSRSIVANIFSPVFFGSGHHTYFLRAYLLRWLKQRATIESSAGRGYVPIVEVRTEIRSVGLPDELIDSFIKDCVKKDILCPDVALEDAFDEWRFLKITAWGAHILDHLVQTFCYMEAVMLDTPIADPGFLSRISDNYSEGVRTSIDFRQPLVKEFVDYLFQIEEQERASLAAAEWSKELPSFMLSVRDQMEMEYSRISRAAEAMRQN